MPFYVILASFYVFFSFKLPCDYRQHQHSHLWFPSVDMASYMNLLSGFPLDLQNTPRYYNMHLTGFLQTALV